jgi:upstream activation factor subunit UAF30
MQGDGAMATAKKSGAKQGGTAAAKKTAPAKKTGAAAKKSTAGSGQQRGGIAQQVKPNSTLSAVIGSGNVTRAELTKKIWDYVKKNNLQDSQNRRMINADAKLKPVFGGKEQVSMFEMTKLVNQHVAKA